MEVRHDDRGINTDCGSVFIGEFRPKQTNVRKIFAYQTCAINTRFVANVKCYILVTLVEGMAGAVYGIIRFRLIFGFAN